MKLEKFIKIQKTKTFFNYTFFSLIIFFFFFKMNLSFGEYSENFSRLFSFLSSSLTIDFSDSKIVFYKIYETFLVAFSASVVGVFFAIIFAPFLTKYFTKNSFITKILSSIFTIFRTIPALVFAAILVNLFSAGSFTGFLSMSIIIFFSATKLIKEYIEEIDENKIKVFQSMGLNKFMFFKACIFPLSKHYIVSVFFLSLESSIRGASVLGLVGAGGIGEELLKNLSYLRYDKVSFIILNLLLLIMLIDTVSWFFRKKDSFFKITTEKSYKNLKLIKKIFFILLGIFIIYSVKILSSSVEDISLQTLSERFYNFFSKLNELDLSYSKNALKALFDSFAVAFFATVLASPFAIILSFFASNILKSKFSFLVKFFINFIRTFPPIIVAIIFFTGFGPGLISGFFALFIYTVGVITKIYVDSLESENFDYSIYGESLGLSEFYIYLKMWFPATFPKFISIFLYRFESNMKNSSVLGMVGAGGIGRLLLNHIRFRNWDKVWVLLLYLILTIIIIENISLYIREKIKK
ncbi:MAG: ABC transporter permease subunit [Fusobacterium sp.]|nr:ABC transporter permease subunit [Fusobacterium sp.]